MRNKPWAADFLKAQENLALVDPIKYKGKWKEILPFQELHVEIGSGKGDYWLTMALKHPDQGWIGIERERNCAALAVKKAVNDPLDNIKFILGDAENIDLWFEKGEVSAIYLNFSDPWPKKRNTKRRLTHDKFLDKYRSILADDGQIILKTDNPLLFEYSLTTLDPTWNLIDVSVDFRRIEQGDAITEYERKFMDEGKPIYRAIWKKRRV